MYKSESRIRSTKVWTSVFLAILLTGCSTNTAQNFGSSSMKMAHHTIILGHQTHRLVDANSQNSSNVNFEYEAIVRQ